MIREISQIAKRIILVFRNHTIIGIILASHVIPQYGSVPVGNFKFPTADPYEGLYWPIFQPIDDIPMDDSDTMLVVVLS